MEEGLHLVLPLDSGFRINRFYRLMHPGFSSEKWNSLSDEDQDKFAPICPEFVIEVASKSDHIEDLKNKMGEWIKNGAQLAWLIDPRDEVAYLYRPGMKEEKIEGFDKKLSGNGPVTGFELDLSLIKK